MRLLVAESTIARYSTPDKNSLDSGSFTYNNRAPVETRCHPVSGLQHPYDKDRDLLSLFAIHFNGCFNCGRTTHNTTRDCPEAKNGNFNKKLFFSEMWVYKPHTKNPDLGK